jgi:hypothetical protein
MKNITSEQRQKFRKWNNAVDKLSKQDKKQESEAWIISALNILNTKKKKLFTLLVLGLFLFSCDAPTDSYTLEDRMKTYENMTNPIIVVGTSKRIEYKNKKGNIMNTTKGSVLLQDSKGIIVTFADTEPYGVSLCASYEKSDTLIYNKIISND